MPLVSDGLLFGALTEKQKENVLNRVGELAEKRFNNYFDAIIGAFDFRSPKTTFEQFALYKSRPESEWLQLQKQDPKEYERQLKQFVSMERMNQFLRLHPRQTESGSSGMAPSPTPTMTGV